MIYLGVSPWVNYDTMEFKLILKIGYTDDSNRDARLRMYVGHNRSFKFLKEIQGGTEDHEGRLHYKFKKYKVGGKEWFEDVPEIRDFFESCTLDDLNNLPLSEKEEVSSKLDLRYPKIEVDDDVSDYIKDFFEEWNSLPIVYVTRLRFICKYLIDNPNYKEDILSRFPDSDKIKQQLITIGPERIASLGYNLTRINRDMEITIFDRSTLDSIIYKEFPIGSKFSRRYIKDKLQEIYTKADFQGKAKANDLENWFKIKTCKVPLSDGSRVDGFEIINLKQ